MYQRVRLVGAVPKLVPLHGDASGWRLDLGAFEAAVSDRTRVAFLMNPENHEVHSKEFRGVDRSYYAMPFAERYIWGATAGILRVLYERIYLS